MNQQKWRCIEVVVTRRTRNAFVTQVAREFESHHLRQKKSKFLTKFAFLFLAIQILNKIIITIKHY